MLLQLRRRADDPAALPHPDRLFVLSEKFRRRSIVADRPIAEDPILVPARECQTGWSPRRLRRLFARRPIRGGREHRRPAKRASPPPTRCPNAPAPSFRKRGGADESFLSGMDALPDDE